MDIQDVLKLADRLVFNHTGKHLDDLQKTIIEGVCQGNKYADIAEKIPCSEGYVRDKASDLWKVLSNLSGEEINKSNFCSALERLQFSISSSVGLAVGVTNNLSLCRDRFSSSENKTNGKKRNRSTNKNQKIKLQPYPIKILEKLPN
ncbi:hypothetical protein [Okeania sp. KiyG1]|uniref:hypothetical protein n=1 Tax=Okeania sp. KiyG1 TaxID=2720165 RepID=UPI001921D81D|nr:hypothetical protein [Okeania sp. KiyG1]GGA31460.1 hypothetical protein CYANOKiyG1_48200 [Okeania sp. KiyG1]